MLQKNLQGSWYANEAPLFSKWHRSFILNNVSVGGLTSVPYYQPNNLISGEGCGGASSHGWDGAKDSVPFYRGFCCGCDSQGEES